MNKIDHSISFKTPVVKHQEEKLEEYNLEDSPTIRKEDVGLLGRPEKNILKEIPREIEEDHDAGDDVEQQRNSQVKEKGSKSMKYHKEEEEEEDVKNTLDLI